MIDSPKNNIVLSDYNFQKDIEHRKFLASLTLFDVQLLKEIVDGPLHISISDLVKQFSIPKDSLLGALEKMADTQLLKIEGNHLKINKEIRKYYETQMAKFEPEFQPDMEFLKTLLSKLPIHVLPNWYAIPQMTNSIFHSLIEAYFKTPKIYQRYLNELKFSDPILTNIVHDVFTDQDFKVSAKRLMGKYGISRDQFEEYMLYLEYNLVCFLGYEQGEECWEEVVTPIFEWRCYLRFLRDQKPNSISVPEIKRRHPHDFGFAQDICKLIETGKAENDRSLSVALGLGLVEKTQKGIATTPEGFQWLAKPMSEQGLEIYRHAIRTIEMPAYGERDIREALTSLHRVSTYGWQYLDEFFKGFTAPIGEQTYVALQNKGKKWEYVFPKYTEEDLQFVERLFLGPFFEAGFIATGVHKGKFCFCVTPFGQQIV